MIGKECAARVSDRDALKNRIYSGLAGDKSRPGVALVHRRQKCHIAERVVRQAASCRARQTFNFRLFTGE